MQSRISNLRFQMPTRPRRRPRPAASAGGFSFVELLFAVIILGIGFIMVAGIFPVAIRQSRLTSDETVAAAGAQTATRVAAELPASLRAILPGAANVLPSTVAGIPASTFVPAGGNTTVSGLVYSFRDPRIVDVPLREAIWNSSAGDLINPTDPRSASVLLFSRDVTFYNPTTADITGPDPDLIAVASPVVRLFAIGVQSRNRPTYDAGGNADIRRGASDTENQSATLEPKPVTIALADGGAGSIDTVTISDAAGALGALSVAPAPNAKAAATEGGFLIVSNDNGNGANNGRIYRLGVKRSDNVFELAPGADMASNAEDVTGGIGYIIGAGLKDPTQIYSADQPLHRPAAGRGGLHDVHGGQLIREQTTTRRSRRSASVESAREK